MLNYVSKQVITLEDLVYFMCEKPIDMFDLKNRSINKIGSEATFTIVDLNKSKTVSKDWLEYKCGWSPFEGETLNGWPVATVIRGQFVMKDSVVSEDFSPKPLN